MVHRDSGPASDGHGLCHVTPAPICWGQQTFSAKGQLVNIASSAATWSLLKLSNPAAVERKQPQTIGKGRPLPHPNKTLFIKTRDRFL